MANFLGWKDILRPIRDGYRHLFPSPDTGPSPEERRKQRALDRLKGFTYFDTFDQLENWSETDSDPIQRANTPLLPRAHSDVVGKANVLLCHDYSGNYHDYEAVQGIGVDEESYACEYLQFVDAFVYFSHKLVCVPPPSWTNTLHRNGVKALGTILIEPQLRDNMRLLYRSTTSDSTTSPVTFPVATKLAAIAHHYNFDGYLVNIEKPFPKETWDPHLLELFLQQLKDDLGSARRLVWYDAITTNNKIDYQNAITARNLSFATSCGSILTNYCWKEAGAWESNRLAHQNGIASTDVFFGVDVWAQNTTKLTRPRVTYPEKGGGGTNSGLAVSKLADIGLSVGLFAPAWTVEHFPGHGRAVERAVWDGYSIPDDVHCSCGNTQQRHPPNRGYCITRSARHFPAGSERFFYTDFTRAFASHGTTEGEKLYNGKKLHSQLGSQSILPHMARSSVTDDRVDSAINILSKRLEYLADETRLLVDVESVMPEGDTGQVYERWLPLFKLDMPADGSLQLRARARFTFLVPGASASIYLKFSQGVRHFDLRESEDIQILEGDVRHDGLASDQARLQEIGVYLLSPYVQKGPVSIVEIVDIYISAHALLDTPGSQSVKNIRLEHRDVEGTGHWRLCWDYDIDGADAEALPPDAIPYSDITGPFSHFSIVVDGVLVGRSYALEYIMCEALVEILRGKGAEVSVSGVGFDGRCLADRTLSLQIE